jgi:hypothetical protein
VRTLVGPKHPSGQIRHDGQRRASQLAAPRVCLAADHSSDGAIVVRHAQSSPPAEVFDLTPPNDHVIHWPWEYHSSKAASDRTRSDGAGPHRPDRVKPFKVSRHVNMAHHGDGERAADGDHWVSCGGTTGPPGSGGTTGPSGTAVTGKSVVSPSDNCILNVWITGAVSPTANRFNDTLVWAPPIGVRSRFWTPCASPSRLQHEVQPDSRATLQVTPQLTVVRHAEAARPAALCRGRG